MNTLVQNQDLYKKVQEAQVNTLIYSMGDGTGDILCSFGLSDDDQNDYKVVKRDLIIISLKEGMSFMKEQNLIAGAKSKESQLIPSS